MLITFDILPLYKRRGRRRSRRLIWQSFWRNANTPKVVQVNPLSTPLYRLYTVESIYMLAAVLSQEGSRGRERKETRLSCIMNECRQKEPTSCYCCYCCCCFAAIPLTAPPKSSTKAKHIYSAVCQVQQHQSQQQQQQQQSWNGVEKS